MTNYKFTPANGALTLDETAKAATEASMENKVKIQVNNLDMYYGTFKALHGIDLQVTENSVMAFIGPSGCGKSTFLKTLNRMNDLIPGSKVEGEVIIDGENIYNSEMDVIDLRRRVGMVFQKPNPFPMSIFDNIAYGPRVHGEKRKGALEEIVVESLQQAALFDEVKDRMHRSALSLSGGQQQRLCIARVLAVKPEIVLMDEPTSALDPISTGRIEELITELKERYTIAIVTHNMQQAGRVSDRTAFFLMGDLIEEGDTNAIFHNPKNPKTEDYITGRFG